MLEFSLFLSSNLATEAPHEQTAAVPSYLDGVTDQSGEKKGRRRPREWLGLRQGRCR